MKALSIFVGVIALTSMMICQNAQAQQADDLSLLKTFGTAGKELRPMADGKEGVLFQREGAGCLTHMWFGGNFNGWEKTHIRVYVDGEANASIDMELGLGHGIGFGDQDAPWGIARMGKIGHGGYLNGAKEPLMLSSGLEDYFLGTYYFDRGRYHTPISGLTHFDAKDHSFSAYRFHDDDPIFFQRGLRLTCRCGEKAGSHVFGNPKATTYTTYAWLYEW